MNAIQLPRKLLVKAMVNDFWEFEEQRNNAGLEVYKLFEEKLFHDQKTFTICIRLSKITL